MNLSNGAATTASRTFCAFLNVTMPVKLTSDPISKICRIRSTVSPKQWNTPARFADERLHLSDGVVPRGALVNDAIQPEFGGDFHLCRKMSACFSLQRASSSAVDPVFSPGK